MITISFLFCLLASLIFGYEFFKNRSLIALGLTLFALSFCVSGGLRLWS